MTRKRPFPRLAAGFAALIPLLLSISSAGAEADAIAFLGVSSRGLTGTEARDRGLECRDGVLLERVYKGKAAAAAGLEPGDTLLVFDQERIFDDRDLTRLIRSHRPGDKIELVVHRGSEQISLKAVLGTRDDLEGEQGDGWSRFWDGIGDLFGDGDGPALGVEVMELRGQLAGYFDVESGRGLLVMDVEGGSSAKAAGLQAGDVLTRIGRHTVHQPGDLQRSLMGRFGETVAIELVRRGRSMKLSAALEEE
jgi:serine protease Do